MIDSISSMDYGHFPIGAYINPWTSYGQLFLFRIPTSFEYFLSTQRADNFGVFGIALVITHNNHFFQPGLALITWLGFQKPGQLIIGKIEFNKDKFVFGFVIEGFSIVNVKAAFGLVIFIQGYDQSDGIVSH